VKEEMASGRPAQAVRRGVLFDSLLFIALTICYLFPSRRLGVGREKGIRNQET
jgi:hypothetical protein